MTLVHETMATLKDPTFELTVEISSMAHQPLTHFQAFIQQKLENPSLGNHVSRLVCGKADEILREWDSIIFDAEKWVLLATYIHDVVIDTDLSADLLHKAVGLC